MPEQCVDLVVTVSQAAVTQSTVTRYTAHWRGVIAGLPQQPETEEDFLAARDFVKVASEEERRIKEALNSILQGSPEIAEIVRTLQELETSLRTSRLRCSKAVDAETEYRKTQILDDRARLVKMRDAELFSGPLAAVSLPDPAERLRNAGKGKRTLETYGEAVHAEAELIIAERTALSALCKTNLDLINAADLPAVSAETDRLLPKPTAEVQAIIARRQAEEEAAQVKKQAAVQRNPDRLTANKADIERISNLFHLDNWRRKHKTRVETELPHPDDQADLWQFFGAHYARVESRNNPPHPADAHQAAPEEASAKGDCKTCWHNQFNRGCKEPSCSYEKKPLLRADAIDAPAYPTPAESKAMYEATLRTEAAWREAAAAPVQPAPPVAPRATERSEGMPETGFAFRMKFHCGELDEEGMQRLYNQICNVVEAAGGEVFEARKI